METVGYGGQKREKKYVYPFPQAVTVIFTFILKQRTVKQA